MLCFYNLFEIIMVVLCCLKIASAVNEGKLVPEEVVFGLLSKRLEEGYCRGENGFILDGIPRTMFQAVCKTLPVCLVFVLILIFNFSSTRSFS